jgi:16S rRNA (adenine1518-N6/adenine1519-N6)-dimethyltransferase
MMDSPVPNVQELLRRYGLTGGAKKSLGQNFLIDHDVARRIVAAADVAPSETVLEIGPGPGVLTGMLVAQAARVAAVELDSRLVRLLLQEHREAVDAGRLSVVQGDVLESNPAELVAPAAAYVVVANLPYYITSPVLRHLLEASRPPERAVVMVQREVAERIVAPAGDLSVLGVSVQFYAEPELLFVVPPDAFRPAPKVESAVLRLRVRPQPAVADVAPALYFRMVRAGFGQKRKQLANSLSAGLALPKAEAVGLLEAAAIEPSRRAETVTLAEWGELTRRYAAREPTARS